MSKIYDRWVVILILTAVTSIYSADLSVDVDQITSGPKHHFFGYIGQCRTIPWNKSGRYIAALQVGFQDHMPGPDEPADIILIDTRKGFRIRVVDQTRAWNPQQGTMLYWNPEKPETQLFFNDRDPRTNKVFCVLFDISKRGRGGRIREYRYKGISFGNSGVAQNGGFFAGINYGRLARLRPVTGYKGAYDWTTGVNHPEDDGIFKVDVPTGNKKLLVSFKQIADALRSRCPGIDRTALFINHTLWNRDDSLLYFYARGNWGRRKGKGRRIDVPFTVRSDGSDLTPLPHFFGGHPEWEFGSRIIGSHNGRQVVYDTEKQEFVDTIGGKNTFPKPGGDIALSPDGKWFVNGYGKSGANHYVIYRRSDGAAVGCIPKRWSFFNRRK